MDVSAPSFRISRPARCWAPLLSAALALGASNPTGLRAQASSATPPRPSGLTLTAKTAASISLQWSAAADPASVASYQVFCDDQPVGQSTSNAYVCTGLVERTSYTFRVRARDASGAFSAPSHALLATPRAGVNTVAPVEIRTRYRALVLIYDPYLDIDGGRVRASVHHGLRDVNALLQEYIELMRRASAGQMVWSVANTIELEEHPPAGPDYRAILRDPRFGIVNGVNSGQIDALWIFSLPDSGFAETAMAGPSPYWVNGGEIQDDSLTRNIVIYGFGREAHQGVGFMCENTCHMTECIVRDRIASAWPRNNASRTFNTLNLDNPVRRLLDQPVNDWTRFTQAESASWDPILVAPGQSQVGLSHFPPAAMHNYNWHTVRYDFGNVEDFRVFDGSWSAAEREYHVQAGDGVKSLPFDSMTLRDDLGDYHPPVAFSDADVELSVRLPAGNPGSHAGFLFRVGEVRSGPNRLKGYYVGLSEPRDRILAARLDDAFVPLAEAPYPVEPSSVHRLRIEARGSTIKTFLNGALEPALVVIDDRYLTGAFGLTAYSTEAWFSDLRFVAHTRNQADQWYAYPRRTDASRVISSLEWDADQDVAMDHFYAWWWEHLPKNGGGHYARDLVDGRRVLILNTWWPYVYDINRFTQSCPFDDLVFPPEDLTPPAVPAPFGALALDARRVGLYWEEPADNVGVTRYAVYRDGALLRHTASRFFIDTRLSPNTTYRYHVRACDGSANASPASPELKVTTRPATPHVGLVDGGFEMPPQVVGWSTTVFNPSTARLTWEPLGTGRNQTRSVRISATNYNDGRWVQSVSGLTPGATYWVTGWIKGEAIVPEPGRNVGANLCLEGTWTRSGDGLIGTFDWRQVSFSFEAPPSGTVEIGCRLGYWSSTASGRAWFDDLRLVADTAFQLDQPRLLSNGHPGFLLVARPGVNCQLERSTDFVDWSSLRTLRPNHPVTAIEDTAPPPGMTRFYRASR